MTNSEYFEAVAWLLGVELGETFKIKDVGYIASNVIYKLTEGGLIVFDGMWKDSNRNFNQLTPETIIKLPFEPKIGEEYFYPMPSNPKGCISKPYSNDDFDLQIKKNLIACRTEAEAIAEAKKRGWTE